MYVYEAVKPEAAHRVNVVVSIQSDTKHVAHIKCGRTWKHEHDKYVNQITRQHSNKHTHTY